MITKKQIQMSETFLNSAVLAVSGGFQDAYTYFTRDKVFSNAQTGNVVLMSQNFMTGNIVGGIKYLFPFLAFGLGVFVTEQDGKENPLETVSSSNRNYNTYNCRFYTRDF